MLGFFTCCGAHVAFASFRHEVSLNDSDDTGSLIDEDDESSEDRGSRSDSDSNDENF